MRTKKYILVFLLAVIFILLRNFALAETFSSPNFKIFDESINFGTEPSNSQNFNVKNSVGETAQGNTSSQNFSAKGGFLQRIEGAEPISQQSQSGGGGGGGTIPPSFLTSLDTDTNPPIMSDISIISTGEHSIRATWQTNEESSSELFYGRTQSFELGAAKNTEFLKNHYFFISNLKPETIYYFQIVSTDKSGNKAKSSVFSAQTLKDEEPPANVSNLSVIIRDSALLLKWQNPLDSDFEKVIIIRKLQTFATNISDGENIFEGNTIQFLDKNLTNGETYFYTIFTADTYGNISSGAIIKGMPRKIKKKEPEKPLETSKEEKVQIPEKTEVKPLTPIIEQQLIEPKEIEEKIEKPEDIFEQGYFPEVSFPPFDKNIEETQPLPSRSDIESRKKVELPYLFQNFEFFIKTVAAIVSYNEIIKQNEIISNEIVAVKDSSLIIAIKKEKLRKPAQSIVATLDNSAYMLSFSEKDQSYKTTIQAPSVKGKYPLEILIIYTDGSSERIKSNVLVDPYGYIYSLIDGQQLRIKDAIVTLYWFNQDNKSFETWPGEKFNQANPQITNELGEFTFFVPAGGRYYLTASKEGYAQAKTEVFEVKKEIININIELKRLSASLINIDGATIDKNLAALLKTNFLPLSILFLGVIILLIFLYIIRKMFR